MPVSVVAAAGAAGMPPVPAGAAVVVGARCTACGACLATCPEGALLPAPGRPLVEGARCTGCMECVEVCPAGAIDRAGAA